MPDDAEDVPVGMVPVKQILLAGSVIFALAVGGIVSLMVIGHRALRHDREIEEWNGKWAERSRRLRAAKRVLDEMEHERNALRREVAGLEAEKKQLIAENRELDGNASGAVAQLKRELAASRSLNAGLEKAMAELTQQLQALKVGQKITGDAFAKSADDAQKAAARVAAAETRLQQVQAEIAGLEGDRNELQAEYQALVDKVKQHNTSMKASESPEDLAKLKADRDRLVREITSNRANQKKMQQQIAALRADMAAIEKNKEIYAAECERLLTKAQKLATQITAREARQAKLQREISALEEKKKDLEKDIRLSKSELGLVETEVDKKNKEVQQLAGRLDRLRVQLVQKQNVAKLRNDDTTVRPAGDAAMQKQLAALEIKVFQAQIKSLQAERNLLLKDVRRLNRQLRDAGDDTRSKSTQDPDSI